MEKMWFRGYGFLDWLSPEAYYTDKWKYLHYAYGSDTVQYDIVEKDGEYRYTNIQEVKMVQLYYNNMEVRDIVGFNSDGTVRINQWCKGCKQVITIDVNPEDVLIVKLW